LTDFQTKCNLLAKVKEEKAMKQLTATDTLALSIPERIQLVEDIWDTIAIESEAVELTEKEKKIIDERLEAYHKNPDLGSPWKDVYQRVVDKK
jgi:putative addiction module component (TIGR02574 family)